MPVQRTAQRREDHRRARVAVLATMGVHRGNACSTTPLARGPGGTGAVNTETDGAQCVFNFEPACDNRRAPRRIWEVGITLQAESSRTRAWSVPCGNGDPGRAYSVRTPGGVHTDP